VKKYLTILKFQREPKKEEMEKAKKTELGVTSSGRFLSFFQFFLMLSECG
jgi:hypothetical protein